MKPLLSHFVQVKKSESVFLSIRLVRSWGAKDEKRDFIIGDLFSMQKRGSQPVTFSPPDSVHLRNLKLPQILDFTILAVSVKLFDIENFHAILPLKSQESQKHLQLAMTYI